MIRIGIVGYGYWGPNLARNAAETEGCAWSAIADFSDTGCCPRRSGIPGSQLHETGAT